MIKEKEADLLKWSMALDFEEYDKEWKSLATSLPSEFSHSISKVI